MIVLDPFAEDPVEPTRQEVLLSVRRHMDGWGRKMLGADFDTPDVLGQIVLRRALRERHHEAQSNGSFFHVGPLLVSPAARHALTMMNDWVQVYPDTPPTRPGNGDFLYGRRLIVVDPSPTWYSTPGPAWTMRHVTDSWLTDVGPDEAQRLMRGLLDDWCVSNGLQVCGPVGYRWEVEPRKHAGGKVWLVTAKASTERLEGVFLG